MHKGYKTTTKKFLADVISSRRNVGTGSLLRKI